MPEQRLHITTSLGCNNRCVFCVDSQFEQKDLRKNVGATENILRNLKKNKTRQVLFTSGEPTLNPKLLFYIRLAKKSGFEKISLITNGRKLKDKALCRALLGAGLGQIGISIHGSNKSTHDKITARPGSFDETLAALKNLSRLKGKYDFELNVHYTITRFNAGDIFKFIKLIVSIKNIQGIIFNVVRPYGRARDNFDSVMPDYSKVGQEFGEALSRTGKIAGFENRNLRININDIPLCVMAEYGRYLGSCERMLIKNYHFLREKSANWLDEKIKRKECLKCAQNEFCPGIYGYYIKKRGWSEFIPIKNAQK